MRDRAGRAAAAAARCTNRRRGSFTAFPFAGSKLMRNNRLEPSRSSSRPDNIIFAWWARDRLIAVGMLVDSPAALARGRDLIVRLADRLRFLLHRFCLRERGHALCRYDQIEQCRKATRLAGTALPFTEHDIRPLGVQRRLVDP